MIRDLETGDGYRMYWAQDFRSGLKLLVEHVDDLRQALVVKDLARTPATPARLMKLLVHLHQSKQLVAGFSFKVDKPRPTTLLLFFPSDTRVMIQTDDRNSPGPATFAYRRAAPKVLVYSEGVATSLAEEFRN